jgi:hypothetical protein
VSASSTFSKFWITFTEGETFQDVIQTKTLEEGNKEYMELQCIYPVGLGNPFGVTPVRVLGELARWEDPDVASDVGQLEVELLRLTNDKGLLFDMLIMLPSEVRASWGSSHVGDGDEGVTLEHYQTTKSGKLTEEEDLHTLVLAALLASPFGASLSDSKLAAVTSLPLHFYWMSVPSHLCSFNFRFRRESDLMNELTANASKFHGAVVCIFLALPSIFAYLLRSVKIGLCCW